MSMWNRHSLLACTLGTLLAGLACGAQAADIGGIGRAATPAEISAWDIDVRPDFKGLPAGSGTVGKGGEVWDAHCASCHGSFGESNQVFTPIIGGTTSDDIEAGRVASLTSTGQPTRTTFMKVDTVSTLWDYIHRAMPWDAPKSLPPDDVYAVLAYLLSLAEIVPDDYTLSDKNMADVQARMPNRDGMMFWDGLWRVDGRPDTGNTACMTDCVAEVVVSSVLPDYARNSNGDLAAQMRVVGPVRGADTLKPALGGHAAENSAQVRRHARATLEQRGEEGARSGGASGDGSVAPTPPPTAADAQRYARAVEVVKANACLSCHAIDTKRVGPAFNDIAEKYKDKDNALDTVAKKIRDGSSNAWGPIPMPPHPGIGQPDLDAMAQWILAGSPQGK